MKFVLSVAPPNPIINSYIFKISSDGTKDVKFRTPVHENII